MTETKAWVKFDKIDDCYGRFTLSPLRPGMGLTIGNSLRRVLLSSLEGSAATSVVIGGVEHEFASLDFLAEDILDLISNIKGIVFKSHVSDPIKVNLEFKEKGKVFARDISLSSDIEVVNGDQYLCELTDSGLLNIEFTIGSGTGFVPSENIQRDDGDVNSIYLDASFSPIIKINHHVDNVRVGKDLDYDSLLMEVWTNGSLDVEDAVKKAATILISELSLFGDLNNEPESAIVNDASESEDGISPGLSLSVEELDLSARSLNCLKKAGISLISELVEKGFSDLIKIKNFGKKSAEEIDEKLKEYGLSLRKEVV